MSENNGQQNGNNGLLDRLDRAEGMQMEVIETLQAISQVVGQGEVQNRLGAIKREKMTKIVGEALQKGELEASETITEQSFVVGVQNGKDGAPLFPGRFQVFIAEVVEDVRKGFIGKKVDETVQLADGGSCKIEGIYVQAKAGAKKAPAKKAKGKAKTMAAKVAGLPPTTPGN